ncbi:hypothetical protein C0993_011969 [Termitomyces sp. T159_Od127]|nr:hypothetical protein C0993_011969 [Termitomyces sp. T159_Od127]
MSDVANRGRAAIKETLALELQPPQTHLHDCFRPEPLPDQPPWQPLAIAAHHCHQPLPPSASLRPSLPTTATSVPAPAIPNASSTTTATSAPAPATPKNNAYGRPVPENYYAMSTPQPLYPAPSIKHYPTLVPRYWAPDQNQVLYGPSISQVPPINTPPSLLGCQQVEAYIQQCDEVLCSLHISLAEFAKHARTLLISLGHHNLSKTLEQWANRLLKFYKLYQCGAISKSAQNTLQVDLNLQDKLHALVDEIHTSPTPQRFEDPIDPVCSFHMQCKEPIKPWDPASTPVPRQQEELNATSNILKVLNPTGGLFDQPAASTIDLSVHPYVNLLPNAFCT